MASLDSATLLKRIVFGALIGAGIFLGSFYLARATSTFIVQQGGTGSTTLGGILKGNGTSPVGSVVVGSGLSYDGTTLSSTGGSGTVTQINTTWPILGGPITTTGTLTFGGLGTSTAAVVGNIPYFSGVNTFANVATTSVSSGTGISFSGTAGALVGGSNLTVTNSSPLSGLSASFPFSFSNPTLTWLGLGTSSPGITAGQPIYATGVNTIASVASSTFLTSIGGQATGNYITALTGDGTASGPGSAALTLATVNSNVGSFTNANITVNGKGLITAASNGSSGGITAIGPTGQTQTGPTVTIATTTSSFNGLTIGDTVVGSTNTLTWTPSLSGTLSVAGGGTGRTSNPSGNYLVGNSTGAIANKSPAGVLEDITDGSVSESSGVVSIGRTASSTFSTDGTLTIGGAGTSTLAHASATQFAVGSITGIITAVSGYLQQLALSAGFSLSGTTLSQIEHRSFTYATSTAWTGTTTIPIESGYGEVFNSVRCFTDAGTLGVDFYHSTSHLNYIPTASTTNNVNTFSTNNTITSGDKTYVDIGTPASSPTKINCTVADTY